MSELSAIGKIINVLEVAKVRRVGVELSYFDAIELLGHLKNYEEAYGLLETENKQLREQLPQRHPASDPPRHPNWVIVCIKGEVFPAVYIDGVWTEWWGDDEPLYTPDWWCELPYKGAHDERD